MERKDIYILNLYSHNNDYQLFKKLIYQFRKKISRLGIFPGAGVGAIEHNGHFSQWHLHSLVVFDQPLAPHKAREDLRQIWLKILKKASLDDFDPKKVIKFSRFDFARFQHRAPIYHSKILKYKAGRTPVITKPIQSNDSYAFTWGFPDGMWKRSMSPDRHYCPSRLIAKLDNCFVQGKNIMEPI